MNINERVLSTLKPLVASKVVGEKALQGLETNISGSFTDRSMDWTFQTTLLACGLLMQLKNT